MTDNQNEQDKQMEAFDVLIESSAGNTGLSVGETLSASPSEALFLFKSGYQAAISHAAQAKPAERTEAMIDELLAYSRALTASLQQQISMDTECIERLRNKAVALEVEIAGLQAIIIKNDEALRDIASGRCSSLIPFSVYAMNVATNALAITSPSAELEAIREEDKAEIMRLKELVKKYMALADSFEAIVSKQESRLHESTEQSWHTSMRAIVEYARKDGQQSWIPMAAFDSVNIANKYAADCMGENRPWIYRVTELPKRSK